MCKFPCLPLCTFVSFVVDELQMLEPQRTQRYTKEECRWPARVDARACMGNVIGGSLGTTFNFMRKLRIALVLGFLFFAVACSPRDFLTRRLASDLIASSDTFKSAQQFGLRTG